MASANKLSFKDENEYKTFEYNSMRDSIQKLKFDSMLNGIAKGQHKIKYIIALPPSFDAESLSIPLKECKINMAKMNPDLHALVSGEHKSAVLDNGLLLACTEEKIFYCSPPWKIDEHSVSKFPKGFKEEELTNKIPRSKELNCLVVVIDRNVAKLFSLFDSKHTQPNDIKLQIRADEPTLCHDERFFKEVSKSLKARVKSTGKSIVVLAVCSHRYEEINEKMGRVEAHFDAVVRYDDYDTDPFPFRISDCFDSLLLPNKTLIDWRYLRKLMKASNDEKCHEPWVLEKAIEDKYIETVCVWHGLDLWRCRLKNDTVADAVYHLKKAEIKDKYNFVDNVQSQPLKLHHSEPFLDWLERTLSHEKLKLITSDLAEHHEFVKDVGGLQALLIPFTKVDQLDAVPPAEIK